MIRRVNQLIDIDPHQEVFVRVSEHFATPVTINFAMAAEEAWENGESLKWQPSDLLRYLLDFLEDAMRNVVTDAPDMEEAYLEFRVPTGFRWLHFVHELAVVSYQEPDGSDRAVFSVEECQESMVWWMNKTFTSWKVSISWEDLLCNVVDLIHRLCEACLDSLGDDGRQLYDGLSSRGLLDREVVVARVREFVAGRSSQALW